MAKTDLGAPKPMQFTFDPSLDYQLAAINAAAGLFDGAQQAVSLFTVKAKPGELVLFGSPDDGGHGNKLKLDEETLLKNLQNIQTEAGLEPENTLGGRDFTIEMETGTGKTYVYLRTIFELNNLYGMTKFIVIVPSRAILEGVATALGMLADHFGNLYGNKTPMEWFKYTGKVSRLRAFATASNIQIMVTTIGSINKSTNVIYKPSEDLDGDIPIDLIRATNPIVIVDEPQSVYGDTGSGGRTPGKGREAIGKPGVDGRQLRPPKLPGLNPLAVFRYSATHPIHDKNNLLFRLDALAAYEKQLVKQIEVDELITESSGVKPYVRLIQVKRSGSTIRAQVETDSLTGARKKHWVVDGDNLGDTTGLPRYSTLTLAGLSYANGASYVQFDTVADRLHVGEAFGDEISVGERTRLMIAETIRQHLRKELDFANSGQEIKVLSLFFVPSVETYRVYDEEGNAALGEYARIFEEEYERVASEPEFQTLLRSRYADAIARESHQGYFAIDKTRAGDRFVDATETTEKGRQQAGLAYEQIMKNTERLAQPGTPIRFIFTHSALQEGWDNPNVFQICVLRNMGSERWRRQSVGRGLRLARNGAGERVFGFGVNRLTVIANESYEEFAEQLQRELAEDLGIEFGKVSKDGFARTTYRDIDGDGEVHHIGHEVAADLWNAMLEKGYIDARGNVQDSLREAVQKDDTELHGIIADIAPQATAEIALLNLIKRLAKPIDVKRTGQHIEVPVVTERLDSPEFRALWERIKWRTEYRVDVSEETLRAELVAGLAGMPPVHIRKGQWQNTQVTAIDQSGLTGEVTATKRIDTTYADSEDLPDILSVLSDETELTRETLAAVLTESGTLDQFTKNPQAYIERVSKLIKSITERVFTTGLEYYLVDESRPQTDREYPVTIFQDASLSGYTGTDGNIVSDDTGKPIRFADKSVYEYVVVDSAVERAFALALSRADEVKAFIKLPDDYLIPTPYGNYNPDWAVMAQRPDGGRYVIFETKDTANIAELPPTQRAKVIAAAKSYDVIRTNIPLAHDLQYAVVDGKDSNAADAIFDHPEIPVFTREVGVH